MQAACVRRPIDALATWHWRAGGASQTGVGRLAQGVNPTWLALAGLAWGVARTALGG